MSPPTPSNNASLHRAGVDLNGLMSVLGKHLYSTPMVAVRELVQNAHDSIIRRRLEAPDWREPGRIEVIPDRAARCLRIVDNGAGLTEDEIHRYLATVGVGYTRRLREENDDAGLIGMFGLGFLSAFVLARRVSVRTTSWQRPEEGHQYLSSHAEQYSIQSIAARPIGSEVELALQPEFESLANGNRLRDVLGRYCALLREPIYIAGDKEPVNLLAPPWRQKADSPNPDSPDAPTLLQHPVRERKIRLEFAARFEHDFEPIATIDLAPEGSSDAQGLLWIQDGATYGTSDNRNLSVFLRGMLLDDDAHDLLPTWAGFIGGVIESNALTPTASREDLQRDAHYYAVQRALAEALIQGLSDIARREPQAWRRVLSRHNEALLGAALCDERLFALLQESLLIPGTQGELSPRNLTHKGAIHVMLERDNDFESMLFRAIGVPLAFGYRYAVLPFLRHYCAARNVRLIELGTEQGNRQLFTPAILPQADADWLAAQLSDDERTIPARFAPTELPLIVVPDRDALLKRRLEEDATDKRVSLSALSLARQFAAPIDASYTNRLYINLDNPAIQALLKARGGDNAGVEIATRLLKAFKVISNARQQQENANELGHALRDLSGAVVTLLNGLNVVER
ncbi:MAG: ATP-binding protein [Azoarcus sp.]|jgi:molecular chaperone HtpG|nr:ATP-binding protein [Azoarcus sp.]